MSQPNVDQQQSLDATDLQPTSGNSFVPMDVEDNYLLELGSNKIKGKQVEPLLDICKKCFSEFLGTAVLVSFGCGAIVTESVASPNTILNVALAFGLTLTVLIASIGPISGCHINPAVTLALMLSGRITVFNSAWYVLAQFAGGITGSLVLLLLFTKQELEVVSYGATVPAETVSAFGGLFVEIVLAFILIFPILNLTSPKRDATAKTTAPMIIGFALVAAILFGGPITGASMNPARSFGPALVGSAWKSHWIYWVGPFLGSLLASMVFKLLDQEFQGALYTLSAVASFKYHPELNPVKEVRLI